MKLNEKKTVDIRLIYSFEILFFMFFILRENLSIRLSIYNKFRQLPQLPND